jgi:hypothetical protein
MAAPGVWTSLRQAGVLLVGALLISGCSFAASSGSEPAASSSSRSSTASSSSTAAGSTSAAPTTGGVAATSGGSAGTSGASPTTSGPGAVGRCHTSELSASLQPGSPGAGQRYATLVLTNTSGGPCTIHGYGGLGLTGAGGAAVPTQQVRLADPAPETVTLAPGRSASAQLHWGAVSATGDATSGPCQPTPAALHVIPPDETASLSVPWTQGPVCDRGRIEQRAYAA